MDTYEATKIVLSRIQSLDPENASRITGYILIQDQGEKEMIRLAFSPESVLVSYVNQAKACLGIPISNTSCSTPSTPSSPSPFSNNTTNNTNNNSSNSSRPNPFSQSSPRIVIPTSSRFHLNNHPVSPSPSSPWSARSSGSRSASYAAVVNGGSTNTASGSSNSSLTLPFYPNNNGDLSSDEFGNIQVQDQLSFLDESLDPIVSPSGRSDSVLFPYGNCDDSAVAASHHHHHHHQQLHRRSCSVNDVFLGGGGEDGGGGGNGGFGWRPCLYFARGFCKNGTSCKFLHNGGGGFGGGDSSPDGVGPMVGSPGKIDGFDELFRLKAIQQQRFAAAQQLMASGAPPPPFAYNKCMNFLNENQR